MSKPIRMIIQASIYGIGFIVVGFGGSLALRQLFKWLFDEE